MKPTKQIIYIPISVEDELPGESCKCAFINKGEFDIGYFIRSPHYTVFDSAKQGLNFKQSDITHWLKPQEGYFFTEEQLLDYATGLIISTIKNTREYDKSNHVGTNLFKIEE